MRIFTIFLLCLLLITSLTYGIDSTGRTYQEGSLQIQDTLYIDILAPNDSGAVTITYAIIVDTTLSAKFITADTSVTTPTLIVDEIRESPSTDRILIGSDRIRIGARDSSRTYINIGDLQNLGNYPNSIVVIDDDVGGITRTTSRAFEIYHDLGVTGTIDTVTGDMYGLYSRVGYSGIGAHAQRTVAGYFLADLNTGARDKNIGIWTLAAGADTNLAAIFGSPLYDGWGNVLFHDTLFVNDRDTYIFFDTTDSSLEFWDGKFMYHLGDSSTYADTADYATFAASAGDSSWDSITVKNRAFIEGNIMFEVHAPTARDSSGGLYLDSATSTLMWVDGSSIFFDLLYPDSSSHSDTADYALTHGVDSTWDAIGAGQINELASLNRILLNSDSILIGEGTTGRVSINIGDLQNIGNFRNSVVTIDEDIGGEVKSTSRLLQLYHDLNGTTGDTITGDMYGLHTTVGYQGIDGFARRVVGGYFLATKNSGVRDKNTGLIVIGDEADTTVGILAYSATGGRAGYFGNGTTGDGNVQIEDTTFFGTGSDISSLSYITKSSTDSSLDYYDGINIIQLNRKSRAITLEPYNCAILDSTFNSVSYKMDITDHTFISGDSIVPCLRFTTDSANVQYYWLYVKWRIPVNYHEFDSVTVNLKRDAANSEFDGRMFNVDGLTYDRTDSSGAYNPMAMASGATPGKWETFSFGNVTALNFTAGDYMVIRIKPEIVTGEDLYLGDVEIYYREQ